MIRFQRSIDDYNVTKKDKELIKFLQKCKLVIEHDPDCYSKRRLVLQYKNFYDVLSVDLTEFNN